MQDKDDVRRWYLSSLSGFQLKAKTPFNFLFPYNKKRLLALLLCTSYRFKFLILRFLLEQRAIRQLLSPGTTTAKVSLEILCREEG